MLSSCLLMLVGLIALPELRAAEFDQLGQRYTQQQLPLLKKYCLECHSTEKREGELDLEHFVDFAAVRRGARAWQKVREMVETREMPPKKSPQMTNDERQQLLTWVTEYLRAEALANAGDPGRLVLRRLSNAEFTYTVRDLTGVAALNPAREFPPDGAAGEGFSNTGQALVMSPTLLGKYFDAGKAIADHAVLLPDGFRFSESTTRRDWTNEWLAKIRKFYGKYADPRGSGYTQLSLQGVPVQADHGGTIAVDQYLRATIIEREPLRQQQTTIEAVAAKYGLTATYLGRLWSMLNQYPIGGDAANKPTEGEALLLQPLAVRWKTATEADVPELTRMITGWQASLWRFNVVGHIGMQGGPQRWLDPVDPLVAEQNFRVQLPKNSPEGRVTVSLATGGAGVGSGSSGPGVVWRQPLLVGAGRPNLPVRDIRRVVQHLAAQRQELFSATTRYLAAAHAADMSAGAYDVTALAERHQVPAAPLRAWLDYLRLGQGETSIKEYLNEHATSEYSFITGWRRGELPTLVANASDQHVRIPGNMTPHSIAVHPTPELRVVVGWRSPCEGTVRVRAEITHAHPECGNGVTWSVEHRRGQAPQRLANGIAHGPAVVAADVADVVRVRPGDLVSLAIGPRDGNHACDLTRVELKITPVDLGADSKLTPWSLTADCADTIRASNPHADRQGHPDVWHFYFEPETPGAAVGQIPQGSLMARWLATRDPEQRANLARELERLLLSGSAAEGSPDRLLYQQLSAFGGPLVRQISETDAAASPASATTPAAESNRAFGLDPQRFGQGPAGAQVGPIDLYFAEPSVVTFDIPADLAAGYDLVTTAALAPSVDNSSNTTPAVEKPRATAPRAQAAISFGAANSWREWRPDLPIITGPAGPSAEETKRGFAAFRELFPASLCYTTIVPVDAVVTLVLFYREDEHLQRLMLTDAERDELNRLWNELRFVNLDAFAEVEALTQLIEFATQDSDPRPFEPLREPYRLKAEALKETLLRAEPKHLDQLVQLATEVYRRPLTANDEQRLRDLYRQLRAQSLPHEDAFRKTLARLFVSADFLYHLEQPGPGTKSSPVNSWELANRLSYWLWSSAPDATLRARAAAGELQNPKVLTTELHRMLADDKTRRLATEFACQWLHIYDFDRLDEKSERHFPTFTALRGPMYEESIQFFTDLFQHNRSVLSILDADHTFLNQELAEHYGIPDVQGPAWRRVDGVRRFGRGGILGQATTLAKQSGASRTSPILRGNWISEVLLGERLPRPPKDVPQLPNDEAALAGLTVRQLVERHSSDARCSFCHERVDPMGFSLEAFDAIGRRRERDLGDSLIDTNVVTMDGAKFTGLDGLREYLLTKRRDAFVRQFCRKLLGYALGRATQLSDEPLLTEMQSRLQRSEYRVQVLFEAIAESRQFREIRGRDVPEED